MGTCRGGWGQEPGKCDLFRDGGGQYLEAEMGDDCQGWGRSKNIMPPLFPKFPMDLQHGKIPLQMQKGWGNDKHMPKKSGGWPTRRGGVSNN